MGGGIPVGLRSRTSRLAKLRDDLTGPQPRRRTVRPPWKPTTDLVAGDVLAVTLPTGDVRLLRTVLVENDSNGSWPLLELLDHRGTVVPDLVDLSTVPAAHRKTPTGNRAGPRRWIVTPQHRGEPSWREAGYTVVGRVSLRPGDDAASTNETWTDWLALREQLLTLEWY